MRTIIDKSAEYVKQTLKNAEGGHDWWHVYRVWGLAKQIARDEDADLLVVELGALFHDIADSKFHGGDEDIGPRMAVEFLQSIGVDSEVVEHVGKIIANISFKGEAHVQEFKSPELDVVQDADRLDAMGAIGIARTFNYGGHTNRLIYDPNIKPDRGMGKEEYKNSMSPSIKHFYEKLLLLKERMNTKTAQRLAEKRHDFMLKYLDEFYKEWDGDA